MEISTQPPDLLAYTDSLLTWVSGRGRILIVVHDNPDPDSLASAMALRHFFAMKLNREAVIAFSGMIGRSENLAMAKLLQIPLTPLPLIDLKLFQVICLLDTQPGTGNNSLPAGIRADIVIDHHPMRESSASCRWVDIRPDYGTTATILYEYLKVQGVSIGTKMATALFYAIKSETQDLGREARRADRDAYLDLFPLANKTLLNSITRPSLPREYFISLHNALEHATFYGEVLVASLKVIQFPEVVAELADLLVRLEGTETVLCLGHYSSELVLSIRTSNEEINAGELIRKLVAGIGAAGGHGMMAGGKIDLSDNSEQAIHELENLLTERLLTELQISSLEPVPLVPESS
ncbi:Kef-type K+ transport system protein [Citrifermentans bremense]|uniref:Kef-type K+ transport system protein n=1 Tax=Citrifermentans bremense TaxID=60035 RepID=A0A6S6M7N0_9BACT|nr:DHH family phosphoesterase [Citrifermentans bremense]BCG47395.1 Kef-type K+ transport system protein [Citrifermentans bremense]